MNRFASILPFLVIASMLAPLAAGDEPLAIGLKKQLLVDDHVFSEHVNVTRTLNQPVKHGPVLKPTLPTDQGEIFAMYITGVRNDHDDKFQMWYEAGGIVRLDGHATYLGTGYAESEDGINWTKPLVSADGKSNIVLPATGQSVTLDPTVDWGAPDKYKAAFMHVDSRGDACATNLAYSADGVHWKFYNNGRQVTHRAADTHNQLLWDPLREAYRLSTRTDNARRGDPEWRSVRIMYHEDNDLMKPPTAWKTLRDRIVVNDPLGQLYPDSATEILQYHHITCWIHEGIYFGILNVWTAPPGRISTDNDYHTRHEEDVSDFYLGTSRDGLDFDPTWVYRRDVFLPRGPAGSWDKDCVIPSSHVITFQDKHWFYYCGSNERIFHASGERRAAVGLATLPLDRFIDWRAKGQLGTITTKPFKLEGDLLQVNVDAKGGRFYMEVLDGEGNVIPGFTAGEAQVYDGIDQLRLRPRWKKNLDLKTLKNSTVRLKFYLHNARLYSFQVVANERGTL